VQKNIAALFVILTVAIGGPVLIREGITTSDEVAPSVLYPDTVEVGELVTLTYAAEKTEWILPTDDKYRVTQDTVVLSFRAPGKYQVIASGLVSGVVTIKSFYVHVGGPAPAPAPTPAPTPGPPAPTPGPSVLWSLADDVHAWCFESKPSKEAALAIADNFITAASTADSIDELLSITAKLNQNTSQDGLTEVLSKLQVSLIENYGEADFEAHKCAWDEIAQGLKRYASE